MWRLSLRACRSSERRTRRSERTAGYLASPIPGARGRVARCRHGWPPSYHRTASARSWGKVRRGEALPSITSAISAGTATATGRLWCTQQSERRPPSTPRLPAARRRFPAKRELRQRRMLRRCVPFRFRLALLVGCTLGVAISSRARHFASIRTWESGARAWRARRDRRCSRSPRRRRPIRLKRRGRRFIEPRSSLRAGWKHFQPAQQQERRCLSGYRSESER